MKTIQLIICELKNSELRQVSLEAIAAAKSNNADSHIIAVVLGNEDLAEFGRELIAYGSDHVVTIAHEALSLQTTDGFSQAILSVIHEYEPDCIYMGHTPFGQELSAKIAQRLDLGLVSDVVEIINENDHNEYIRAVYSGKAFEKKIIKSDKAFITIRPNNFIKLEKDVNRNGDIVQKVLDITSIRDTLLEQIAEKKQDIDIRDAEIIIAGGRGVETKDTFQYLYTLAEKLGGTVGASKGAVELGLCDATLLIGQTGAKVTPRLYFACGISGATQHIVGMSNADIIVAINKDPDAPIFEIADYGIVGDVREVLPLLITHCS